jgi:hypothetical protein
VEKETKQIQHQDGATTLPPKHTMDKQTVQHLVSSLFTRARNLANYLLLIMRKNYQSQIGLFAISSAFILTCFYLFSSWKTILMESVSFNNIKKIQQRPKGKIDIVSHAISKKNNKSILSGMGKMLNDLFTYK